VGVRKRCAAVARGCEVNVNDDEDAALGTRTRTGTRGGTLTHSVGDESWGRTRKEFGEREKRFLMSTASTSPIGRRTADGWHYCGTARHLP
jgi:hypothetical protein